MIRKVVSLVICLTMVITMLAGCSNAKNDNTDNGTDKNSVTGTADSNTKDGNTAEDPYEVVMSFATVADTPADLQKVEDSINAISVPEINVKVKLYPISLFNLSTQANLMIANNEKLDLLLFINGLGSVSDYVNKGMLLPLDDLVKQYGTDITAAEGRAMAGGYIDNVLYSVPSEEKMGRQYGFGFRTDILQKYGYDFGDDVVTYEQLDEMFAKIKAGEGKDFYMLALSSVDTTTYTALNLVDTLGVSSATGVLMNGGLDDTTIVDLYETDQYMEHLKWMRKWYLAGYINPDALTLTDDPTLIQSGKYLGSIHSTEGDSQATLSQSFGTDVTMVNTTQIIANTGIYQTSTWGVPITCENPEATMKFLNLLYKSEEVVNLIRWGIEGSHYVKTDDPRIIKYPDGIDRTNTGYNQPMGVFGNKFITYQMVPATSAYYDNLAAFNAKVTDANSSKALGYTFNTDNVKTEKAAIDSVISQYARTLEYGAVDPDEILPEFINALKAAGIDKVVAENQKALDQWLANK